MVGWFPRWRAQGGAELRPERASARDSGVHSWDRGARRVFFHRRGASARCRKVGRCRCNFGSAHPENYRKALGLMRLADKFGLPIVTLIDTAGA